MRGAFAPRVLSAGAINSAMAEIGESDVQFSPPLYKQRYSAVVQLARKLQPRRVDVGCAECKLLRILKREEYIEELIGVDVDEVVLRMNTNLVKPLITDHLHPRPRPLHMALLRGSIAHPDARLKNFDLLTFVEVIEHLDDPILQAIPMSIFGYLRPAVVVMTTPNAEFNVLFPGFSGFRHHDHRFEWTRNQFQSWCEGVCDMYGYNVEFDGVGTPPPQHTALGCCSQMATFTRSPTTPIADPTAPSVLLLPSQYETVADADHPSDQSNLTPMQKLRLECEYYLHVLRKSQEVVDSDEQILVPLKDLMIFPKVQALVIAGLQDIRTALEDSPLSLDVTGNFAIFSCDEEEEDEGDEDEEEDVCVEIEREDGGGSGGGDGCSVGNEECWD